MIETVLAVGRTIDRVSSRIYKMIPVGTIAVEL